MSHFGQQETDIAVAAMKAYCYENNLSVVMAIADSHGELMALFRLDGAPLSSIQIASNKAYTAARERKPSKHIGTASRDKVSGFELSYFGDRRYTGWGGGLPIMHANRCIGSVAVSGLTEDADESVAQIGLAAILAHIQQEGPS